MIPFETKLGNLNVTTYASQLGGGVEGLILSDVQIDDCTVRGVNGTLISVSLTFASSGVVGFETKGALGAGL